LLSAGFVNLLQLMSRWSIPVMLLVIPLYAQWRGVRVYESFVAGAAEGVQTAIRILPFLLAMWVALTLMRSSGLLDQLMAVCTPLTSALGIPPAIVPLAIIRPLSGSGALSMMSELIKTYGPDSPLGQLASIVQGSTETTFYVITVYLGAVSIRRTRHIATASLIGDLVGLASAVFIWQMMF
jgi:spore maturation protein B